MSEAPHLAALPPRAGFVALAFAWFVLCGFALVRPAGSAMLREGEDAGRTTVDAGVGGDGPAEAWLQVALLAMSPTALDEEILVADELPLQSTRAVACELDWMHRSVVLSREFDFGYGKYPPRVRRQRELGSNFPRPYDQAWVHAEPIVSAKGAILRIDRVGASSGTESFGDLDLEMPFDQPLLMPLAGGGVALLLRVVQVPSGRTALEHRATWCAWFRASWSSLRSAHSADELVLQVEQQALAGLWLRDEELLRAAKAAAPQASLPEPSPAWRRLAHRASAIARGDVDAAAGVPPRSWNRMLAWRALRLAANDASAPRLAAWLLPAASQADFAAGLLASDDVSTPAFAPLVDIARRAVLPTWLRAVPWLWPLLLATGFVVLVRVVRSPRHGVAPPLGMLAVLLLGASATSDFFAPLPLMRWVVLSCLCVPRWRSMDRLWRILAAGVLVAELAGLLVVCELLPNTPTWPNLALLANSGSWVLVRGLVSTSSSWKAPGLLTAFTAMSLLGPAAPLVPGFAWIGVHLVDRPIAWILLQGGVLFGFVFCGVRHLHSPLLARRLLGAGAAAGAG